MSVEPSNTYIESIKLEKRLDLRNILIEKGLLAITILAVGLIANSLVEKYKSELLQKQAQSELLYKASLDTISDLQRYENQIDQGFADILIDYEFGYKDSLKLHDSIYYQDVFTHRNIRMQNTHLFSSAYNSALQAIEGQYMDLIDFDYAKWNKYGEYFAILRSVRTDLHKAELSSDSAKAQAISDRFAPISNLQRDKPGNYLELNFQKWQNSNKNK